jgi:putative glutamine amidotransferase
MRMLVAMPGRLLDKSRVERARNDFVAGGERYLAALRRAGAEGAVLAPREDDDLRDVLARFDALLLPGGGDVDPTRYGQAPDPSVRGVSAEHDAMDIAAVHAARSLGLPILAICRGAQVLNVALGGTLVQHMADHRLVVHGVDVDAASRTATAMGTTRPDVHCVHHQAIDRLGAGLTVTSRADGGSVEGVELEGDAWVVGVQWHPEDRAATDPANQGLFDAFVRACHRP